MAIATRYNTAPAFRNTFFDLLADPLIEGKIQFSEQTDHNVRKAVYKSNIIVPPAQTPEAYTNPLILNLSGAASCPPIFFASDSNYFIEIFTEAAVIGVDAPIQTIENWNAPENINPTPGGNDVDLTNYIANGDYAVRFQEKFTTEEILAAYVKIADPGWYFTRTNTNATNTIEFVEYTNGQTDVPENPIAAFKYSCTAVGAGGETAKDLAFQIEDAKSLSGQEVTLSFNAKSALNNVFDILVRQYFGSTGSTAVYTNVSSQLLTTTDTQYTFTFTIPSILGKSISPDTEAGTLQIIFRMPLNQLSDIEISIAQLHRGAEKYEYNYLTPKQVNAQSVGLMIPERPIQRYFGRNGSERIYDWQLNYRTDSGFVWEPPVGVSLVLEDYSGKVFDTWVDLNLQPALSTSEFPRLFAKWGVMYGSFFTTATRLTNVVTVTSQDNGNVTDAAAGTSGFTVNTTQQGSGVLPEIFTVQTIAASSITAGTYLDFSTFGGTIAWRCWIRKAGAGALPSTGGKEYICLDLIGNETDEEVAEKFKIIVNPILFGRPQKQGLFTRGWDNGAGVDPDAATRTARPDGVIGDNIGTTQADEFKSHDHDIAASSEQFVTGTNAFNSVGVGTPPVVTDTSGGAETRGKNIYARFLAKY